jgi:hypothetical protein
MSKNVISLAGRAFKAEPDGNVLISLRQLKGQDLRLLPAGTSIVVSDFRKRHADPIKILKIMDKGMPDFAVGMRRRHFCVEPPRQGSLISKWSRRKTAFTTSWVWIDRST